MSTLGHERKKPRLKDIAEYVGVSIGTVSRVLNGKSVISSEVSEKILKYAQQTGYVLPNSSAREKRKSAKGGIIAYLVDKEDLSGMKDVPFYQYFLAGIQQVAGRHSSHVLYAPCGREVRENTLPAMVADHMVKGVILKLSADTPDEWIQKLNAQVPVVLLMGNRIGREVASVGCDNANGVYQALRYLKNLGHQRIGFLSVEDLGMVRMTEHDERLEAFLKYAPLLGVEDAPRYVQNPLRDHAKEDLASVVTRALNQFLSMGEKRPTAIVCAADEYAFSLMQVASAQGLVIPDDFSLIALRDTVASEFCTPPLTGLSLQEDEIGRQAAELLQKRIDNPASPIVRITVAMRLIERLSCAKAPGV